MKLNYGIVLMGLPGSGKTTIAQNICDICKTALLRPVKLINLDPANSGEFDFDIQSIIQIQDAQVQCSLGPNGSLLYCLDYLLENIQILESFLKSNPNNMFVFDLPGQVECYVAQTQVKSILERLQKQLNFSFSAVHLADCMQINTAKKYLHLQMTALSCQVALQIPFVFCLNKCDLLDDFEGVFENFRVQLALSEDNLTRNIVEFINQNGVPGESFVSALDSKHIVQLICECDQRVSYTRGELGEYQGKRKEEVRRVEEYIREAVEQ